MLSEQHRRFSGLDLLDRRGNEGVELFPLRCQLNTAAGADKQWAVQRLLQIFNCPGDIGLAVVQNGCRLGEALGGSHLVKNTVVVVTCVHADPF